jgi:hypothetical protein
MHNSQLAHANVVISGADLTLRLLSAERRIPLVLLVRGDILTLEQRLMIDGRSVVHRGVPY